MRASAGPRDRLTAHQLVEIALLSNSGLILHEQRKVVLVELLEPFIPTDLFQ
jgi:hypothetical protein